jgi:hypothetical protein
MLHGGPLRELPGGETSTAPGTRLRLAQCRLLGRIRNNRGRLLHPTLRQFADKHSWVSGLGLHVRGGGRHSPTHLVGMPIITFDRGVG